jgi:hypothetical protein
MSIANPVTATEILDEVIEPIEPSFTHEFSRIVLNMRLSDEAQERIRGLLRQNNAGTLKESDRAILENYLLVGKFIDLLQAKARASLQGRPSSP